MTPDEAIEAARAKAEKEGKTLPCRGSKNPCKSKRKTEECK